MTQALAPDYRLNREHLVGLLAGFMPVQLAYVMARLRLADLLEGGSMTADELSSEAGTRPDMMRRLVRGLAGVGLVSVDGDAVSVTEMGALLGSRVPGSRVVDEVVAHYDFSGATRVLDVGGGRGHLLAAVLSAHPGLLGAVFDVPSVAEAAVEQLSRDGVGDRWVAMGGDFFEALPPSFDVHILKWILHDWNDEDCRRLLARCREALPDHGRLLVVEQLLPEAAPAAGTLHPAVALDLIMLVNFAEARERYLEEYARLLDDSGFELVQVVPLPSGFSILDCRPRA
jgi:hypothetical protein